jgi:hypothetical protein
VNFDRIIESIIKDAQQRGDFDNLPGKGKPIDLEAYFNTPEEVRNAYAILKNAGIVPAEIELLQDIAALKDRLTTTYEENERSRIQKIIRDKQLQFNLMMDQQKRQRREKQV